MKPDLKRGDDGPDVEELQDLMNRLGLLLATDGDFGGGTERAVKECQALAGLPQSGESDAALWEWLEAQPVPDPRFSTEGVTFVCREEVGGRAFYESHAATPHWPSENSGVTIGMGYDLQFQSEAQLEADWGEVLDPDEIADLKPWLGKTGSAEAVAGLQHIRIPITDAWRVFL
jgi:peptidoglycan hydrolase-like protein with peptidoglycan-binding domain